MDNKIKINLGKVQETLLLPLWGRAVESEKKNPRLIDIKASEIIHEIEYDFSTITNNINWMSQFSWVVRCIHIDNAIFEFIKNHPHATIVNIGCGLDTTFDRVDNGRILFYELDLPDVISLRTNFFPENERRKSISCSFLEDEWLNQLRPENGILFIAAGVFYYFTEIQIKNFFISLANRFPGSELFFDCSSRMGMRLANKRVIKAGGMDETAILKWGIPKAKIIEDWDNRIHLLQEFPMFYRMKKGYSIGHRFGLWMSDFLNIMSMVHLRLE